MTKFQPIYTPEGAFDLHKTLEEAPAQRYALQFILDYKKYHDGNAPSRRVLARFLSCSQRNVRYLLDRLAASDFITFDESNQIMVNREIVH